jgi:hypothetical protein
LEPAKKEVSEQAVTQNSGARASGFSIASFVLGITGIFIFGLPAGILAVVFGGIALSRYKRNPDEKLRGLAIAGLILGIVDIIGVIIVLANM